MSPLHIDVSLTTTLGKEPPKEGVGGDSWDSRGARSSKHAGKGWVPPLQRQCGEVPLGSRGCCQEEQFFIWASNQKGDFRRKSKKAFFSLPDKSKETDPLTHESFFIRWYYYPGFMLNEHWCGKLSI